MPYLYVYAIYILVFLVPCFVIDGIPLNYFLACALIVFSALFAQGGGVLRKITIMKIDNAQYGYILIVLMFSIIIFLAAGYTGLTNRADLFDGKSNYVTSSSSFFKTQIDYIIISFGVFCLSFGVYGGGRVFVVVGSLISAYIITSTGTRWLFLLSFSPVMYNFLATRSIYSALLLFLLGVFASFYISMNRDSNVELDLDGALLWDVPSFQSVLILKSYQPTISGLIDFFNGNVLILIPRMLWPNKPLDSVVTNYMLDELGFAFEGGATILPGVVGLGWLYGGYVGIVFIGVIIGLLMRLSEKASVYNGDGVNYGVVPLVYVGALLQLRGFSVFYFMPAIYLFFAVRVVKWTKKSYIID